MSYVVNHCLQKLISPFIVAFKTRFIDYTWNEMQIHTWGSNMQHIEKTTVTVSEAECN